jgi:hypothetical protein
VLDAQDAALSLTSGEFELLRSTNPDWVHGYDAWKEPLANPERAQLA